MSDASLINVLAIPAGHRYSQQIRPEGYRFLADPTEPWWPHPGLEPAHVRAVVPQLDLVHLHFGFEHRTPAELAAWVDILDEFSLPLVLTVHDIRNPHLVDNKRHEDHLGVLLGRAAVVLTLTACAAAELRCRWGCAVTIVEHPPLYEPVPGVRTEPGLVGVTFKDRPSSFGCELLEPICAAARAGGGRVQARCEPGTEFADGGSCASTSDAEVLTVGGPLDDGSFAAHLARLAVAVLPYRFGTHSGWLEACRDLGTRVVAPTTGCYRDQWSEVLTFDSRADRLSFSLQEAVTAALDLGPIAAPSPAAQHRRLDAVRSAHDLAYRLALAGVRR